jgi:hypothetical protein
MALSYAVQAASGGGIPDPSKRPFMSLWPETGRMLGLGRSSTFEAARRGEIPTVKFGARLVVPTAALRRLAQIDVDDAPRSGVSE